MSKSKRALLKTPTRLMPIVFLISVLVNATWAADGVATELFYDDGIVDAWGVGSSAPDLHFQQVLRFHSPWECTKLVEAKLYIMDTLADGQNALGYPCDLIVKDANRETIFSQEVIPDQAGWFAVDLRPYIIAVPREFYVGVEITHSVQVIWGDYHSVPLVGYDRIEEDGAPAESWFVWFYEPGTLGYYLHGPVHWEERTHYNFMIRAVVSPLTLQDALDRVDILLTDLVDLHEDGEIDQYKFNRIAGALNMAWAEIINAMDYLDTARHGFDDMVDGLYALKSAVSRLEYLINDLRSWVSWDWMSSGLAEDIIQQLESIDRILVCKARSEAKAEKMLAVAAIEDAESRGRSVPWLWNAISYIENYLAEGDHWVAEGWLSKAVSYYKMTFYYSQRVVINAWHWSWDISPEDWIDQLEESL